LKDLLDVCLHNANHYLIYENKALFLSFIEKIDPVSADDLVVISAIIKNIAQGNKSVIEHKFIREEILRCSRTGNLTKIKKLIEHGSIIEIA
jgi:hypothetical protein